MDFFLKENKWSIIQHSGPIVISCWKESCDR